MGSNLPVGDPIFYVDPTSLPWDSISLRDIQSPYVRFNLHTWDPISLPWDPSLCTVRRNMPTGCAAKRGRGWTVPGMGKGYGRCGVTWDEAGWDEAGRGGVGEVRWDGMWWDGVGWVQFRFGWAGVGRRHLTSAAAGAVLFVARTLAQRQSHKLGDAICRGSCSCLPQKVSS